MTALAIIATFADMASMRWETEVNPLVMALGWYAFPARLAVLSFALAVAAIGSRRIRTVLLAWATAVGVVGAWSNTVGLGWA